MIDHQLFTVLCPSSNHGVACSKQLNNTFQHGILRVKPALVESKCSLWLCCTGNLKVHDWTVRSMSDRQCSFSRAVYPGALWYLAYYELIQWCAEHLSWRLVEWRWQIFLSGFLTGFCRPLTALSKGQQNDWPIRQSQRLGGSLNTFDWYAVYAQILHLLSPSAVCDCAALGIWKCTTELWGACLIDSAIFHVLSTLEPSDILRAMNLYAVICRAPFLTLSWMTLTDFS
jgi:hypothetical protein